MQVSCPGFTSDVVREVPLDVAEALGQARVEDPQPQLASDTQTVQWCCCFDSGSVTLVGMIQTPTLVQGQPFDLSWQVGPLLCSTLRPTKVARPRAPHLSPLPPFFGEPHPYSSATIQQGRSPGSRPSLFRSSLSAPGAAASPLKKSSRRR